NPGSEPTDGLETCREIRRRGFDGPVVMLTAREGVHDRVEAVKAGADDHIVKHLALQEIRARIQVAISRREMRGEVLQWAELRLDLCAQRLTVRRVAVELTKHQWLLILRLMHAGGELVSSTELCQFAGIEPAQNYKNLRTEMHRLRFRLQ